MHRCVNNTTSINTAVNAVFDGLSITESMPRLCSVRQETQGQVTQHSLNNHINITNTVVTHQTERQSDDCV